MIMYCTSCYSLSCFIVVLFILSTVLLLFASLKALSPEVQFSNLTYLVSCPDRIYFSFLLFC